MADSNFGGSKISTRPDPDWITGWGKRRYNWAASASVEREMFPGFAMTAGYYWRRNGNQAVVDNTLVTPADYDPYCVTAPVDPRLGSVSGSQVCGLYDIRPEKFGLVDLIVTFAKNYGNFIEMYKGFDVGLQARLPRGARVAGGVSIGNSVGDNASTGATVISIKRCFVVDSPQEVAAG